MLPEIWFSNIYVTILLFIVGLVLIVKGGDWFVDASSWIAEKSGIPKFIIGATIVSIATTLPELLVSVFAAIEGRGLIATDIAASLGSVDMAIGNAIGSVNANIGLILALSFIFLPSDIDKKSFFWKPLILFVTVILLFFACLLGKPLVINGSEISPHSLTVIGSIFVILMLVVFIVENLISAKKIETAEVVTPAEVECEEKPKSSGKEVLVNILKFVGGAVGIVLGAELLIDGGTAIATAAHVPTKIIALTMVAIGTSLPELVTTITAIVKKQSDLSVGNIVGANVIDMALILPVCSFIYGGSLPVTNNVLYLDIIFGLVFVLLAILPGMIKGKSYRWQGISLFCVYILYIVLSSTIVL